MKKAIRRLAAAAMAAAICASAVPARAVTPNYKVTNAFAGSRYYRELDKLELTGNYRADLVNVALTQVGYHEGEGSKERDGMNMTSAGNYTEYGYYSGCDGYAWCAMFVSWCARQAQIPKSVIADSRVARAPWFEVEFEYKADYKPLIGDIIFFAEPDEVWSHVGIVLGVTETGVYTVEGNSKDMVRIKFYEFDDEYIKGYGYYPSEPCSEDMIQRGNIYRMQFDLNGGEGKRRDQYALDGAALGLYANAPDEVADDEEVIEEPENNDWCWKDGCEFVGWYARRDRDGAWLTDKYGWRSAEEIVHGEYQRRVYGDMGAVYVDASWGGEDNSSYTFYAVWEDAETGRRIEDSAFIYERDSKGWLNTFKDIRETDEHYEAEKQMIRLGLINGVDDNIFGPEKQLTRAQFLTMLYRYDGGMPANAELPYTDVNGSDWFYDTAVWAYKNGVSPDADKLKPNAALTREEAAQYLYNYALLRGKAVPTGSSVSIELVRTLVAFSDISIMSPSYLEAVIWTYGSGILAPIEAEGRSMLRPKAVVNRAEACEMLSAWLSIE